MRGPGGSGIVGRVRDHRHHALHRPPGRGDSTSRRLPSARARSLVGLAVAASLLCAGDSEASGKTFLTRITPLNASRFGIEGKEADWIYGDIALRNDRIAAIVANPVNGRTANWKVRNVGCAVIDLTQAARPNDLLTLFQPASAGRTLRLAEEDLAGLAEPSDEGLPSQTLRCVAEVRGGLAIEVRYTLADGWDWIEVETSFANRASEPIQVRPFDQLRAEFTFQKSGVGRDPVGDPALFWAYDRFFGQAYGVDASAVGSVGLAAAPIAVEAGEVGAKLRYTKFHS